MGEIPGSDAPWEEIARYAMTYDAYERWFGDLGTVAAMIAPLQAELDQQGEIPAAAGVDALRAWLFVLIRSERFSGGIAPAGEGVFTITAPPGNPAVRKIITALHERDQLTHDK